MGNADRFFDAHEVRRAITALIPQGDVFEIRLVNAAVRNAPVYSGYFTSVDVLLDQLSRADLRNMNTYIVLNSLPKDLHSRVQRDHFEKNPTTTGDTDVLRRQWILIDCDPQHLSGISSTNEETAEAEKVMQNVRKALEVHGITPSIVGFSGNGYHLLLAVDMPNTQAVTDLVKRFLSALDAAFSTAAIKIDVSVCNASRISKVYGTKAQKGADSPERPHRFSKILESRERIIISEDALEDFMLDYPPGEDATGTTTASTATTTRDPGPSALPAGTMPTQRQKAEFDLVAWCETYIKDLVFRYEMRSDGLFFVWLKHCPFNPDHAGKDAKIFQLPDGRVFFRCFHNSCQGKTWWDVLKKYDPEEYERRTKKKDEEDLAEMTQAREAASAHSEPIHLRNVSEYEEETPRWLFEPYIARGSITILVGTGGTGKTSLWCNLAAAVSTGGAGVLQRENPNPFEDGSIPPENVLYFSAEDSTEYILKRRLLDNGADVKRIWNVDPGEKCWSSIKFGTAEGTKAITECVQQVRPALVIFDPVQSFLPNKVDMAKRNHMRNSLEPLMQIAKEFDCAVLIAVHTNKMANVSGRARMADSSDLWDIARSVLMLGLTQEKTADGDYIRYLSHEKTNMAVKMGPTIEYMVDHGKAVFREYTTMKDADYVIGQGAYKKATAPAKSSAESFILQYLIENGTIEGNTKFLPVATLDTAALSSGIAPKTLRNAKKALKDKGAIKIWALGGGPTKTYFIRLCQTQLPLYEDRTPTPEEAESDLAEFTAAETEVQEAVNSRIRIMYPNLASNAKGKTDAGKKGKQQPAENVT